MTVSLIALFFCSVFISFAESVNYFYDGLNQVKNVQYGKGRIILYTYDGVGNRLELRIINANPQLISQVITSYYNNILDRAPEPGGAEAWGTDLGDVLKLFKKFFFRHVLRKAEGDAVD